MVKKGEIPWKHQPKRKAGRWRASSDTAKPEARKLRSKQTKKNGKIQIPLIPPSPCFSDKQDLSYKINWQFINSWNEKQTISDYRRGRPQGHPHPDPSQLRWVAESFSVHLCLITCYPHAAVKVSSEHPQYVHCCGLLVCRVDRVLLMHSPGWPWTHAPSLLYAGTVGMPHQAWLDICDLT